MKKDDFKLTPEQHSILGEIYRNASLQAISPFIGQILEEMPENHPQRNVVLVRTQIRQCTLRHGKEALSYNQARSCFPEHA